MDAKDVEILVLLNVFRDVGILAEGEFFALLLRLRCVHYFCAL